MLTQGTLLIRTTASYGYDVKVSYDVQTTFKNIRYDVQKRVDEATLGGYATDLGAEYINGIIELCKNTAEAPTYQGSESVTFDIIVDANYELSLNIKLFDKIDEAILPIS